MAVTVPPPCVAPEDSPADSPWDAYASWYEEVLGWPVAGGPPAGLVTGVRFDVLELPADAGAELLRRPLATGPVALTGRRMRFLVAAGSADELEGLLDWLEWGGVALDLTALGVGGRITAPVPPGHPEGSPRGAAVWLRPPEQGCEALLPSLPGPG
ncbi:proline-rich protein, partial [Streptomyces sp. NRRL S-444]